MKALSQILEGIELAVEQYDTCTIGDVHTQSEIARTLSVNLFFLAEHKVEAYKEWLSAYHNSPEKTDGKREKYADNAVQSFDTICQIQKSGENLLSVIRTTISANK